MIGGIVSGSDLHADELFTPPTGIGPESVGRQNLRQKVPDLKGLEVWVLTVEKMDHFAKYVYVPGRSLYPDFVP